MNDFTRLLEPLWSTTVESFNINMLKHTIELTVKSCDNNLETSLDVIFEDVVAYCWINDSFKQGEGRLGIEKWNYIDLTSANYAKNEIAITGGEWESKFKAFPNIVLEMWDSMFLIEAKRLIIDGKSYTLINE